MTWSWKWSENCYWVKTTLPCAEASNLRPFTLYLHWCQLDGGDVGGVHHGLGAVGSVGQKALPLLRQPCELLLSWVEARVDPVFKVGRSWDLQPFLLFPKHAGKPWQSWPKREKRWGSTMEITTDMKQIPSLSVTELKRLEAGVTGQQSIKGQTLYIYSQLHSFTIRKQFLLTWNPRTHFGTNSIPHSNVFVWDWTQKTISTIIILYLFFYTAPFT